MLEKLLTMATLSPRCLKPALDLTLLLPKISDCILDSHQIE